NLRINGNKIKDIKRILIYAFIYEGVANWSEADGIVTIKQKQEFGQDENKKTLVIGLGNRNITSDALGPKSVSKTLVTRHLFKNY
ncbi:GPR endopeptidase, partial [Clostridioides difficile]